MAECEVYPGDEIRVVDKDVVDNGDLGGLFGNTSGGRQREFGFAGTALTGGARQPAPLPSRLALKCILAECTGAS